MAERTRAFASQVEEERIELRKLQDSLRSQVLAAVPWRVERRGERGGRVGVGEGNIRARAVPCCAPLRNAVHAPAILKLRWQLATLEREHDLERKEAEVEARAQAEVKKEVEELVVALERQGDTTQRQASARACPPSRLLPTNVAPAAPPRSFVQLDISKLNASMIKQLEKEISNFKWESMKQRKSIYTLEKDREKLGAQASDAGAKYMLALEEVKLREMTMVDLQKKISEGDARLKQQQSLYEAVRSDRNLYSKNLIESQDEIAEMKRKFKIMNHQIEQLKEEIGNKDQAFVKEHIERTKAEKEKEAQKNELMRVKRQVFTSEAAMKNFEAERAKLDRIIDDADRERFRQKTECAGVSQPNCAVAVRPRPQVPPLDAKPCARTRYDIVINERDILGTQLIRRNDELALLYEKMKTQQRTISKVFGASKATARAPSRARLGQAPTPAAAGGTCVP